MSNKLWESVKHLAVEDDEPKAPVTTPHVAAPVPHPAFNLGSMGAAVGAVPAPAGSPFAVPSTTVLDEKVYQSVLAKTNFDTTPVGKTIHKYFDALEGSGLDTNARFKAAMKQAAALDNISADQVLATFDQMQAALEADAQGFQKVADGVEANQITARQTKVTALQQQVETINQQIAQLQAELVGEQNNHANAVTQYGLAEQRRTQEIAAQKTQFAALLR
jgi:hypothetical protein